LKSPDRRISIHDRNHVLYQTILHQGIMTLQRQYRVRQASRSVSAKKIQVLYFSWRMKASLAIVQQSVTRIQKTFRGHLSRQMMASIQRLGFAAAKIQSVFRNYQGRKKHQHLSTHTLRFPQGCHQSAVSNERDSHKIKLKQNGCDVACHYLDQDSSATLIQAMVRSWVCQNVVSRRKKMATAATTIQTAVRSRKCHTDLFRRKDEAHQAQTHKVQNAAVAIQSAVCKWICQKKHKQMEKQMQQVELSRKVASATKIQATIRLWNFRRILSQRMLHVHTFEPRESTTAAITIQSLVRSRLCQKRFKLKKEAHYQKALVAAAVIKVQTFQRNVSERMKQAQMSKLSTKIAASTTIQAMIRAWACRSKLYVFTMHAVTIQRCYSRFCCSVVDNLRLSYTAELRKQRAAATAIQSVVRYWTCRRKVLDRKKEIYQAQPLKETDAADERINARHQRCQKRCEVFEKTKRHTLAAIQIQSIVRSWACRAKFSIASCNAVKIQKCYRSHHSTMDVSGSKQLPSTRLSEDKEREAAIILQAVVRSWHCRRDVQKRNDEHVQQEREANTAVLIQATLLSWNRQRALSWQKAQVCKLEERRKAAFAVTKIQAMVRSWSCKREVSLHRAYAIRIQRCYRTFACIRSIELNEARLTYLSELRMIHQQAAATAIQAAIRSRICQKDLFNRKEEALRARLLERTSAAIMIQAAFRSWSCQCEVTRSKEHANNKQIAAVTTLQAMVRSWICKRNLIGSQAAVRQKHESAIIIQAVVRSLHCRQEVPAMEEPRELADRHNQYHQFPITVKSANCEVSLVLVQRIIRGFLVRSTLMHVTKAARTIQAAWYRYIAVLRMKLVQTFESSSSDKSTTFAVFPSSLQAARVFLPRDPKRLKRVRDITPLLPRQYECGVFVEEILNSVTIVIQAAARRYIARQKLLSLIYQRVIKQIQTTDREEEETQINAPKELPLRLATDDEIERIILAQIYQEAQSNLDTLSPCVHQYVQEFNFTSERT